MQTLHENSVIILLCDSYRYFQIGLHFHCRSSQQFCQPCSPCAYQVYKNIFVHGTESVADRYCRKFISYSAGSLIVYGKVKILVF